MGKWLTLHKCRSRQFQYFEENPYSDPSVHHGTCVTHVSWCMSGLLTRRWWGKHSRHSRRTRNPQFYVYGKRPMGTLIDQTVSEICAPQSLHPIGTRFDKFLTHGQAHMGQMGKWPWRCTTGVDILKELRIEKICPEALERSLRSSLEHPPARPLLEVRPKRYDSDPSSQKAER